MKIASIRGTLYAYVVVASLAAMAGATVWMYSRAHAEIDALQDAALESAARLILAQAGHEFAESYHDEDVPAIIGGVVPDEALLMFQIWSADGTLRYRSSAGVPDAALAPATPKFGLVQIGGRSWRTVTLTDVNTQTRLVMAEPEATRTGPALHAIRMIWLPALMIMGAALLAIALGVHRSLRPLVELTRALTQRPDVAAPVTPVTDVPQELRPVLEAYNQLVQRARDGWDRERRYTADVAHELRTPLSVIATHLSLLQRQAPQAEYRASLESMHGAVRRAAEAIDQLLLLARLDAGVVLPATRVQVNELVRSVLAEMDSPAGERRISLELVDAAATYVMADASLLTVAVRNLVANSVRYADHASTVTVTIGQSGGWAEIVVEDVGVGVAPETRERMFERFVRGETGSAGGTGLGLPLVREIARRCGGDVMLLDRLDGRSGLRALLRLPLA